MIFEVSQVPEKNNALYDVCIIGSGPAGATLANILAESELRVCVLESGEFKPHDFYDALRDVDSEGIYIKPYSRERVVGGASTTWSALSSPLDHIDFKKRSWVKYSGWPIGLKELEPYYREASKRFRFPSFDHFYNSEWMNLSEDLKYSFVWENLVEKTFIAPETPQNFADEFNNVYKQKDVDLIYGCTVTSLNGNGETGAAEVAVVMNRQKDSYQIKAKVFVIACGGIENARLLLNSHFACKEGLGNDKDQVGRYFMNHLKNNYGFIKPRRSLQNLPGYFGFLSFSNQYAAYKGLRLNEAIQEKEYLLNSYIRFQPVYNWSERQSIEALMYFIKRSKLLFRAMKTMKGKDIMVLRDYTETGDDTDIMNERKSFKKKIKMLLSIASDFPLVADYVYHLLFEKKAPRVLAINLRNFMEMEPLPENRVLLGSRLDVFGMRLPFVIHNPSELDKRSMASVHAFFAQEKQTLKLGSFHSRLDEDTAPWPIDYDASHHMGSTRMGHDVLTSVVNSDCRLHYSPNVYVAGSSVFPTSGNANPTYTLVALSIRLGEHLISKLASKKVNF